MRIFSIKHATEKHQRIPHYQEQVAHVLHNISHKTPFIPSKLLDFVHLFNYMRENKTTCP